MNEIAKKQVKSGMVNWKTTLGGFLTAIGVALSTSDDETIKALGVVLAAVGAVFGGVAARDGDKTSQQSGAE